MIVLNQLHIDSPQTWDDAHNIFQSSILKETNEVKIKFNDPLLKGAIKFLCYNYIQYYEYDFTFSHDVELELCSGEGEFYFLYCLEGRLRLFTKDSPINECLSFQPGIFPCPEEGNISVVVDKDIKTRFTLIKLIKNQILHSPFESNIYDTLESLKILSDLPNPFYFGNYNLKIAEAIEQLNSLEVIEITQKYFNEGMLHIILGYQIQQYFKENGDNKFSHTSLTKDEAIVIKDTAEFICENLEMNHTIESLCKRSGMYACKLQEGFKAFYNRTVVDYIRNERLKEAEHLIKNSDYNISQIVYSVGFTSRSYFSKIFKEKYNCSPKFYQKNIRTGKTAEE